MGESDSELVCRWQSGDEAAFTALVGRWETPLARFLSRLAPPDLVPDLAQEVFLRLYRAGAGYRENGHFSTWFFQIALNVARDALRRRRPTTRLPVKEPPDERGTLDSFERRELGEFVARAIHELPPTLREVLALRHDGGHSFEEMARMLDIPASTLKSRFATALLRLRSRLAEWGFSPDGES